MSKLLTTLLNFSKLFLLSLSEQELSSILSPRSYYVCNILALYTSLSRRIFSVPLTVWQLNWKVLSSLYERRKGKIDSDISTAGGIFSRDQCRAQANHSRRLPSRAARGSVPTAAAATKNSGILMSRRDMFRPRGMMFLQQYRDFCPNNSPNAVEVKVQFSATGRSSQVVCE